jgi:hypothetical protein
MVVGSDGFNGLPEADWHRPILGVRYNVIRRPLSGGKGSIKPLKAKENKRKKTSTPAETMQEYYARLGRYIQAEPETYFMRWTVEVSAADISKFKKHTLHPLLENLLDDYEWWAHCETQGGSVFDYMERMHRFPTHRQRHYRMPYGIFNPLTEGGVTDIDEYLDTGSEVGLVRETNLFPELES